MDYARDQTVTAYRDVQRAVPGIQAMYGLLRAIMEAELADGGRLLLVGAGGGRELEALGPSPRLFTFTAVDPSPAMLALARTFAEAADCAGRTRFLLGETTDVASDDLHDGATALLVMHFLPDDGRKLAFLRDIHARLRPGAPYLHADVCFDSPASLQQYLPWFISHARQQAAQGFQAAMQAVIENGPQAISGMPIVGESRMVELFKAAGFEGVQPVFRGLWYAMWAMRAAP